MATRNSTIVTGLLYLFILSLSLDARGADEPKTFELRVLDAQGHAVREADVEIRVRPVPSAEQIQRGKFVRRGPYGAILKTDSDGILVIAFPTRPAGVTVLIETAGHGPYSARWSSENASLSLPPIFAADLDDGWSVGGVVVDEQGNPVGGAKVHPHIKFKQPENSSEWYTGTTLTTDANGQWRFDSVPVSMTEVHVEVNHPDFMPHRRTLARDTFEVTTGDRLVGRIALNRGIVITGTVTDEAGLPIAGALLRTKFLNDIREAKTNAEGVYRIAGCEPRTTRLVVSAPGRAVDMKEVRVDAEMPPVDFQMKPGGKIRVRVVDEHDKPIAKARIFFQRWRGPFEYFEFDHVYSYTDANGVWQWNEAPLDGIEADICRPDGMQLARQPMTARDEEYVFHPPPRLIVSGNVIDAETKKPIPVFQVVPGIRGSQHLNWVRGEVVSAKDGQYSIQHLSYSYDAHLVRIEAAGYLPGVSREIKSDEGKVKIDFELKRGEDILATILTPDGKRAANAKIVLGVIGSQISIKNGQLDEGSTYNAIIRSSNAEGEFRFPPQDVPYQIVVLHPSGFAHVKAQPETTLTSIPLAKWAQVEGEFRIGKKGVEDVPITISVSGLHEYGDDVPHIYASYDVRTRANGRFSFDRVVPGEAQIGRRIMLTVDDGAADVTSARQYGVNLRAGDTNPIILGGFGRPVVGKLEPPAGFMGPVPWSFATIQVRVDVPMPTLPALPTDTDKDPERRKAGRLAWEKSAAGRSWKIAYENYRNQRVANSYFTATVARDGTFRIDDMPVGSYLIDVRFDRKAPGHLRDYRFAVDNYAEQDAEKPIDLGVIKLERE